MINQISLIDFPGSTPIQQLHNAVDYLREHSGSTLLIPPGTYRLQDPVAIQLQQDIMAGKLGNNPEDQLFTRHAAYAVGLDFSGITNCTIEGYGALFLVEGFMEPIALQRCEKITLKGITIDHLRKPYSKGTVLSISEKWTDVLFADQPDVSEKMPSARIAAFDQEYGLLYQISASDQKEIISPGVIRFYNFSCKGKLGDQVYIWHSFHYRPAIHIYEAADIFLEDVTIHSQPGMGIVGHRSKNITLHRLKVVPSAGERLSTNTDATHFASCSGFLRFQGCQFEGQGDDSTNVHGYYYTIQNVENEEVTLTVEVPTHNLKLDYPSAGDQLELSKKSDVIPLELYTVKTVEPNFEDFTCRVTLDRPLPLNYADYYLANATAIPQLDFLDCVVSNHIARGVLVKTRQVRIENCLFFHTTGTAIHVAAEADWQEGITAADVLIQHNRILDCGHQGWGRILDVGGISINILSKNPQIAAHKNIRITHNIIDCPHAKYAIYAGNVDGLVIENNELSSMESASIIHCCENVIIQNNRTEKELP